MLRLLEDALEESPLSRTWSVWIWIVCGPLSLLCSRHHLRCRQDLGLLNQRAVSLTPVRAHSLRQQPLDLWPVVFSVCAGEKQYRQLVVVEQSPLDMRVEVALGLPEVGLSARAPLTEAGHLGCQLSQPPRRLLVAVVQQSLQVACHQWFLHRRLVHGEANIAEASRNVLHALQSKV